MQLSEPKVIRGGISFNIEHAGIYIIGFRVMNGFIIPPQSKGKTGKYYPLIYLTRNEAGNMYDMIMNRGWNDIYALEMKEKSLSIIDLCISASVFSVYYER